MSNQGTPNSAPATPQEVSDLDENSFVSPEGSIKGINSPRAFGYPRSPDPDDLIKTVAVKKVIEDLKIVLDEDQTTKNKILARRNIVQLVQRNQDVKLHIRYDMEFRRYLFRDEILRNEFSNSKYEQVFDLPRGERVVRKVKCFAHLQMEQLYHSNLMYHLLKAAEDGDVVIFLATNDPDQFIYQMEIEKTVKTVKKNLEYKDKNYTLFRSVSEMPGEYGEKRLIDYSCPDFEKFGNKDDHVTALSFFMYMLDQTNVNFYARISEELEGTPLWTYLHDKERFVLIPVLQDSYLRFNKVFQYDTENIQWATDDYIPKPLLTFKAYKAMTAEEIPIPPKYPSPIKYADIEHNELSPLVEEEKNYILTNEEKENLKRGLSPGDSSANKKPKMGSLDSPPPTSQHFVVQTSHVKR